MLSSHCSSIVITGVYCSCSKDAGQVLLVISSISSYMTWLLVECNVITRYHLQRDDYSVQYDPLCSNLRNIRTRACKSLPLCCKLCWVLTFELSELLTLNPTNDVVIQYTLVDSGIIRGNIVLPTLCSGGLQRAIVVLFCPFIKVLYILLCYILDVILSVFYARARSFFLQRCFKKRHCVHVFLCFACL